MEKLLKIDEVAKILNVCTKTLRRWDAAGKLVPLRTFGKHRRYKLNDIEMILNEKM